MKKLLLAVSLLALVGVGHAANYVCVGYDDGKYQGHAILVEASSESSAKKLALEQYHDIGIKNVDDVACQIK